MSIELAPPPVMPSEWQQPLSVEVLSPAPVAANVDHAQPPEYAVTTPDAALLPPAEAEERGGPSLKFVMWEHVAKNTETTAQQVADCDVVAMEWVGFRNERQRQKYEAAATTFVSSTATAKQQQKAGKYLQRFSYAPFAVLERLQGTDKRIVTIDVNSDDPEYASKEVIAGRSRTVNAVYRAPSSTVKSLLLDNIDTFAQWNAGREARVVQQVQDLAGQYEGQDVKIGVLIGAGHTPVQHELSRLYPSERVYAVSRPHGQGRGEKIYFPPYEAAVRHRNFLPGVPVPEAVLNRAVLQQTQATAAIRGRSISGTDRFRLLENLSDAEVSELIVALDGMKSGVLAKLRRKQTLQNMDRLIAAKLDDVEKRQPPTHPAINNVVSA